MRVVFSRKGFDSSAGGVPSPIVNNRPVSLPIPQNDAWGQTYGALGLGGMVQSLTKGQIGPDDVAHHDPQFHDDRVFFGQSGAAQKHLDNQGVGPGDVFLFFGLFADRDNPETPNARPHHRIFGWMQVEKTMTPNDARDLWPTLRHPHLDPSRTALHDTLWTGKGGLATHASDALRLTSLDATAPSFWTLPDWMRDAGLSYHANPSRWGPDGRLQAASRGQEFVAGPHPALPNYARDLVQVMSPHILF